MPRGVYNRNDTYVYYTTYAKLAEMLNMTPAQLGAHVGIGASGVSRWKTAERVPRTYYYKAREMFSHQLARKEASVPRKTRGPNKPKFTTETAPDAIIRGLQWQVKQLEHTNDKLREQLQAGATNGVPLEHTVLVRVPNEGMIEFETFVLDHNYPILKA